MATPTMLSVGSVTLTANGGNAGAALAAVAAATATLPAANVVTVGAGATALPAAPTTPGLHELVIQPGYTGTLVIPTGWSYVIDGQSSTGALSGGDATTTVVGADNYSGSAGAIIATSGSGTISSTSNSAVLSFAAGSYDVTAVGNADTINLDNGATGTVHADGSDETLNLGTGTAPATIAGVLSAALVEPPPTSTIDLVPTVVGGADTVNVSAGTADELISRASLDVNASGGAVTVLTGGAGNVLTVNATGGFQLLLDNVGGSTVNEGPTTDYQNVVGLATASTLTGSTGGDDTVWALTAVDYKGALSASTFFVGSQSLGAAESVAAGADATVFGGADGGNYTMGSSVFDFFGHVIGTNITTPSADNISGSTSVPQAAFIWGADNENLTVTQTTPATNYDQGEIYVAFGASDTIGTASSSGGNSFIVFNTTLPGGTNFLGDTTLIASNTGLDAISFFAGAATVAHTVTIENWQSTDIFFMGSYSQADVTIAENALTAASGGGTSFTLSDGTTIDFVNKSPLDNTLFQHPGTT